MTSKLYVGNLARQVDNEQLKQLFSRAGSVVSASVVARPSGQSKGFGFVEMSNEEEAKKAVEMLNGQQESSRGLIVMEAKPKPALSAQPAQAQPPVKPTAKAQPATPKAVPGAVATDQPSQPMPSPSGVKSSAGVVSPVKGTPPLSPAAEVSPSKKAVPTPSPAPVTGPGVQPTQPAGSPAAPVSDQAQTVFDPKQKPAADSGTPADGQ